MQAEMKMLVGMRSQGKGNECRLIWGFKLSNERNTGAGEGKFVDEKNKLD